MTVSAIVRRVRKQPLDVIAFRTMQEARLLAMQKVSGWRRLQSRVGQFWTEERVSTFLAGKTLSTLLADDALDALRTVVAAGVIDGQGLVRDGRDIAARRFSIFGVGIPENGPWPWHEDWRFGYRWEPKARGRYDFYADRAQPYDVKLPWELSRLIFLPRVLQAASLAPPEAGQLTEFASKVLLAWEDQNPLGGCIAWYPMEASMRALTLVITLDMLRLLGVNQKETYACLLRLLAMHGEYIWRNREYSQLRGNHYAANVVALAAIGCALEGFYPSASRWISFAHQATSEEIMRQFLADGVQFEKATGYQRLVTELFLFSLLLFERRGTPVKPEAAERMREACQYTAACARPDGLIPEVGDDDDGRAFHFDPLTAQDVGPITATAQMLWPGSEFDRDARAFACPIWLLGSRALSILTPGHQRQTVSRRCRHFEDGGVVVARDQEQYLFVDVGEVGLGGHGGHGHNDLLSFEFFSQGCPLVVDPGSFVYTADPKARNLFRSSAYHNSLVADGEEIAPLIGIWRIADSARPHDVRVTPAGPVVRIEAGHCGYRRLPDPVDHNREIRLEWETGTLEVFDSLKCSGRHSTVRSLHLAKEATATLQANNAMLTSQGKRWELTWNAGALVSIEDGWVSPGYSVRNKSTVVRLANEIEANCELWFKLRPLKDDESRSENG